MDPSLGKRLAEAEVARLEAAEVALDPLAHNAGRAVDAGTLPGTSPRGVSPRS